MRYPCYFCGKSVTSELPHDSVIRALLVCPECMEKGEIVIVDKEPVQRRFDWEDDVNVPK